jgi:hypothetical protein
VLVSYSVLRLGDNWAHCYYVIFALTLVIIALLRHEFSKKVLFVVVVTFIWEIFKGPRSQKKNLKGPSFLEKNIQGPSFSKVLYVVIFIQ